MPYVDRHEMVTNCRKYGLNSTCGKEILRPEGLAYCRKTNRRRESCAPFGEDYSTGLDGGHFGWAIRRKVKACISVPGEALQLQLRRTEP